MSGFLIVAEHDGSRLAPATAAIVAAARQLAGFDAAPIAVLVAGPAGIAAEAAKLAGVARVLHQAGDRPTAEALAPLIVQAAAEASHVLAPATSFGRDLLPRAAALADRQPVTEIVRILGLDTFVRPLHAGNVLETVRLKALPAYLTLRPANFAAAPQAQPPSSIVALPPAVDTGRSRVTGRSFPSSGRPELGSARIIVAGGRGLGSAANFRRLEALADRLGAALAATRAAVDEGFAPNDWQVGQTGRIVAPDLYIAVGISGAIQHVAGMKDSKTIVAINRDAEAPIFKLADYGLVMDLFEALDELARTLPQAVRP